MYERSTRVYRRAIELVDFAAATLARLPTGYGFVVDQLRRVAASVPLNYVEGCGRRSSADRRRFFDIAVGSANEVAATLDVLARFGAIGAAECARGQDLADHVASMLRYYCSSRRARSLPVPSPTRVCGHSRAEGRAPRIEG